MPGLRPGRPRTSWGRAYEATLEAVISVVLAMVAGYYADRYFETEPILLFIGLFLGGAAAMRRLLKIGPGTAPESEATESPKRASRMADRTGRDAEGASPERDRGDDGKGNG